MFYASIPYLKEKSARIVLGGDSFGASISEKDSFALMDRYLDHGGNHIDTAHLYGIGSPGGEQICEKVIGKWIQKRGNRHHILLSTKGAHPLLTSMHQTRVTKKEVERDLKESLFALRTDYIDLYWLHRDHPDTPAGEILEWMNDYVKEGLVRALGASNWTAARLREADSYAAKHRIMPFAASQILYSAAPINKEGISDDTLVWMDAHEAADYRKSGMPLFCYSSQAKGYFSKLAAGQEITGMTKDWFDSPAARRRANAVAKIARIRDISPAAVALAYLWSDGINAFPIAGCKKMAHLEDSLSAKALLLTKEEVSQIKGDDTV